jgi:hypothetical protein
LLPLIGFAAESDSFKHWNRVCVRLVLAELQSHRRIQEVVIDPVSSKGEALMGASGSVDQGAAS